MMNERIRQLRKLAERYTLDHPSLMDAAEFSEIFDETFAELIVRECIDIVLDCSVEYATRPQIAEELKEHFGVE